MPDLVRLARIRRAETVESQHLGAAVVMDAEGATVAAWGDPGLVTFPRSSLKPFQAVALVETGAADAFGLTEQHIALACASHAAQPFQVAMVREWLERLGLEESALVCGPDLPRGRADMMAAVRGGGPRRIYHNCSGKHCGFLTVSRHLRAGLDYASPAHPAQRLYLEVLSEFLGRDAAALPSGVDGCGLPALALPIADMARAAARFGIAAARTPARQAAVRRVLDAMAAYPDHVSGEGEPTGHIVRATGGRVRMKSGAEGFVLAMVPERRLGIAVKIVDGATRGKMGVLVAILARLGLLGAAEAESLGAVVEPPILDSNGQPVGRIEVTLPAL